MEIANEGIFSNFFTKVMGRKEKADTMHHGSGKPMTFNDMANTSDPRPHNYRELSNKLKEMYPTECEKEFKLRKDYLKEIMRVIPKLNKEFAKYCVETKDYFEIDRKMLNGIINEDDDYYPLYMDAVLPNSFPETADMSWYSPNDFIVPICGLNIYDLDNIAPKLNSQVTLDTSSYRDNDLRIIFWDIMKRVESFIDKNLSNSQCYGGIYFSGDYEGGVYHIIIVPSDQMIDLAMRVTSEPEEKEGLKLLKDYKKNMKTEASKRIGWGSEVPKELKALLGVK